MAMRLFVNCGILASLWLCTLLLLQARHGGTAPTHHLTVSVEGNTPTLIATSAEIGITPRIVHATTIPPHITTAAAVSAVVSSTAGERSIEQFASKGNIPKQKGKSYKWQYEKKWQYEAKEREKVKGKSKLVQDAFDGVTTGAVVATVVDPLSQNAKGGATNAPPPTISAPILKPITVANDRIFEESTAVGISAKENIIKLSDGLLAAQDGIIGNKPSPVGSARDAMVSAVSGYLPRSTEPATEVTLAPTAASSSRNAESETVGNIVDETIGAISFQNVEATSSHVVSPKVRTTPGLTTAEKFTATTTFMELHDTTAAKIIKDTSTATPTSIPTPTKPSIITTPSTKKTLTTMFVAKKSTSTTTSYAPIISIEIEKQPMANTATTPSFEKTTVNVDFVTSPLTINNHAGVTENPTINTKPTTTAEFTITDKVASVSQIHITLSTLHNIGSATVNTNSEGSSTSASVNLSQPATTPASFATIAIRQSAINASTTPASEVTRQKMKASTSISTTTTLAARPTLSTTKSVQTIQATQKANTDSGIIFIDDVTDNGEATRDETEAELQNDEAIIDVHENIKDTKEEADSVGVNERIIKLIDLEKHDLKSISKVKPHHDINATVEDDDGHDGVKKTKKKQLTNKHYLTVPDTSGSAEFQAEHSTPADLARRTLASIAKYENKGELNTNDNRGDIPTKTTPTLASSTKVPPHITHQLNIEQTAAVTPTLRPVHNGYLGPIIMEEKRFTVMHANHKPLEHHESTIESQLRNGRFIEILAPTALMEQNTGAPVKPFDVKASREPTTSTTSVPPQVSATLIHVKQTAPMLSTTVFQVPDSIISTTRLPLSTKYARENEKIMRNTQSQFRQTQQQQTVLSKARTESKISDIQVEVYDSTVDSIVASTNFKDSDGFYSLPLETEVDAHGVTTKPPVAVQERFTQYVVDRADYATQESSAAPHLSLASGKPEPAAIEIHINVSEGIGNESEDLEFSYRQPDYTGSGVRTSSLDEVMAKTAKAISMKPPTAISNSSSTRDNVERGDEILVVEIIDTGDNSTEVSVSAENVNPIFTFRSDAESDIELKDIKYYPPEVKVKPPQMSDELFLVDMKGENALPKPPLPPPPPPRKPTIDRDSDTIFYISNTEVKVGESIPTANTDYEQQQRQKLRKTKLENEFFPANYLASTHPNAAGMNEQLLPQQHRYEEDIILSPLRNTADSLKIFRSQGDGAPPLDVTYVGESVMEVEQSPGTDTSTTIPATALPPLTPDVIIQPAILPEMSIGVPVIGELPPQIELKEIDFMPDEANQQHSGMYENNMLEDNSNANGNDVDRLVESSVQYGGDLIDESAGGGGFDGVEGSYPFGNPVALHNKAHHEAVYTHFTVKHGVSNLRKDELSADVPGSGEMLASQPAVAMLINLENNELKELLTHSDNETLPLSMLANGSYVGTSTERMSNATAYNMMEDPNSIELVFKNHYTLIIGIFIVLLPVVLTVSMTCAMWFLYLKFYGSPNAGESNQTNGNIANGKKSGENGSSQEESTIDTANSIPKQLLPSSNENPSNGHCCKVMQNKVNFSHVNNSNDTKPSSNTVNEILCNAASGATFVRVDEKLNGVMLLPAEISNSATDPLVSSVSMPLKPGDNNKSSILANLSNNSVQENFTRPNGSVTKMTLKNNHLIVETEERHDISRVARKTTMHYNNSEKDGVFVVEVARGVDSKSIPSSPTIDEPLPIYEPPPAVAAAASLRLDEEKILRNHEEIQIHQPPPDTIQQQPITCLDEIPERSLHQIVELEEPALSPHSFRNDAANETTNLARNFNTGLSQSDLSSTSSTDSNKRYSYGNQELYTLESNAYVATSPSTNLPLIRSNTQNLGDDNDRRSENGHSLEHSPAAQGNGAPATANDSVAVCNELPKPEEINHESSENTAERSEDDSQQVNIVPEIGTANEPISSGEELVLNTAKYVREQVECQTVFELEKKVDEVEIKEGIENIQGDEVASISTTVLGECISNNNILECVREQEELPISNDTDTNTILQLSDERETKKNCDDEENSFNKGNPDKPLNGELVALLTFPQPITSNYGYESIISLPDPPSTEEIKQLADFVSVDSNQLDSLPPPSPPPPPIAMDLNENNTNVVEGTTRTTNSSNTEEECTATQLKLSQLLNCNQTDLSTAGHCQLKLLNGNGHDTTNGNTVENGHHETINGHGGELNQNAPCNTEDTEDSTGTTVNMPESPLTPPESPPLASPVHYTNSVSAINGMNGVNRGICVGALPVAVDVNGS